MIGFFEFEEVPNVENPIVLAHLRECKELKGRFFVRVLDGEDVSNVKKGSLFFGVLDDDSGFGACLFVEGIDVEPSALLLQKNLHVKGDQDVDGSCAIGGDLSVDGSATIGGGCSVRGQLNADAKITTSSTISAKSPNTNIILTPVHVASIGAAITSGTGAALSGVVVTMENG